MAKKKAKVIAVGDWDALREDVSQRILQLQVLDETLSNDKVSMMIRRDLIMPWVERFVEFCALVNCEEKKKQNFIERKER